MKKLIIAEKPSVAREIAKVVGASKRNDGYLEGDDVIVSWCVGHLVGLANPEAYDKKYKFWNLDDLPIFPDAFQRIVYSSTKKQFQVLKKLMHSKNVDSVVNACDAGREGELIFRLVYEEAGCKKPSYRLWISSMEASAIKDALRNIKPSSAYDTLYESARARQEADWLIGMNLSRYYTKKKNQRGIFFPVGRVQTPTLAMIVARDDEIKNFQKEKYYTVELLCNGMTLSTERIDRLDEAENILNGVGDDVQVSDVILKKKTTKPDLPFDLTTLQRECNKYFGYSAKETLDYTQSLYEKKLVTYPRTDSRHLTQDMVESITNGLLAEDDYDSARIQVVFNSAKVSDHHAIIPTASSVEADLSGLSSGEEKVYRLISDKFHSSFGFPLIENTTKVIVNVGEAEFTCSGKVVEDDGFTKFLKEYKKSSDAATLPSVNTGDILHVDSKEVKEKYTSPPAKYTEDTLLKAMETAGSNALEEGVEVERKGIGTPATRASTIEALVNRNLIRREKKALVPTESGCALVAFVDPIVTSAEMTAEWENELYKIKEGAEKPDVFQAKVKSAIRNIVSK